MSTARVGIDLDLMNGEQVLKEVERIEAALKAIGGSKFRADIKTNIADLRKQLESLEADKKTIKIDTKQADARIAKLKKSIKQLNQMLSTKRNLKGSPMSPAQIRKAQVAVKRLNRELQETQKTRITKSADLQRVAQQAQAARQQINLMNRAMQNVKPLGEIFTSATAKASHIGSAFQTLGSGLNRLAQPMRMLMGGTLFAAGYKFLNMANEGLSNALERYDTMENYAKSMSALGEDANKKFRIGTGKAMTAVENLNEAVLGLPTGLNEIVDAQKRFYSASGDMEKATKMAIAANNAFLASGTEASEKLFGERQLRTLLSVGKLTSAQWQSLSRTMPLAMQSIAKELGYGKDGVFQMTQDINSGKVAVDDFIDAFTRLGTTGVIANAANVMKHSFQGVQANITNAFSRMGYNLVKTFDQIFQKAYGKDTIDMLYSFRDVVDKASEGIQKWIKSDPDFFIDTIERLKNLDWKGFAKGFGEGIKGVINFMLTLGELTSKIGAERIGKFMAWTSTLANMFTLVGSLFRGGRHLFGGSFVAMIAALRILGGKGVFSKGIGKLKDLFTGLTGVGKEAKKAEKAFGGKGLGGLKGSIARWGKPLAGIGAVLGVIAATAGTIMLSTKAIKSAIKDMGEISRLAYDVDWDVIDKVGAGFAGIVGIFTGIGTLAGRNLQASGLTALGTAIAGGITTMVAGFAALDIKLVESSMKSMVNITKSATKIFDNIDKLKGIKGKKGMAKDIAGKLYGVYEAMFNTGGQSLSDIKWAEVKKGKKAIEGIKDIFNSIVKIKGSIEKLKDFEGIDDGVVTNIQGLFKGLNQIYGSLNNDLLNGENGAFNVRQLSSMNEAMSAVAKTFRSISEFTSLIPSIQQNMGGMMGRNKNSTMGKYGQTAFGGFVQNIKSLFKGINEMYVEISGSLSDKRFNVGDLQTKLSQLASGIESIRKISNKLNKLGGKGGGLANTDSGAFKAIDNIKPLIRHMKKALGDADLGGLKAKVDSFVSSVKSLLKQLNNLGGNGNTVDVTITINGKVKGHNLLIQKIQSAIDKIKAKCKPLTITKKVTVNISRTVNITGDAIPSNESLTGGVGKVGGRETGGSHNSHTGGYIVDKGVIYRAHGGSVLKPKGTDTIPAMLTRGEYVHRKSATDFWGVRFMQKINNLDVNGVMREMQARASNFMNINRGTTINNNTTNNNDITQNVYTSNPNFAFRRSSRYVGAL